MLAYLLAPGLTLFAGDCVLGASWLALHLVLLGTVTNASMVWSDQFAAALLQARPSGEPAAVAHLVALNLAVVAVLAGVHLARPALTATGVGLLGAVVVAHAVNVAARLGQVMNVAGFMGLGVSILAFAAAYRLLLGPSLAKILVTGLLVIASVGMVVVGFFPATRAAWM